MEYVYVLYLLLVILIIVAVLLLMSIAGKKIPFIGGDPDPPLELDINEESDNIDEKSDNKKTSECEENETKINGGSLDKTKKIWVVDGLNYICDKYLAMNKNTIDNNQKLDHEENLINSSPNIVYIWKAISNLRAEHKKDYIVFVIKNQDGYKLSIYDDKLYKKWAKMYKMGIIVCYDPVFNKGPHYVKGRDDKTVVELFDKYKNDGYNVELISVDKYDDRSMFGNIPSFKKIKYGNIPFIDN